MSVDLEDVARWRRRVEEFRERRDRLRGERAQLMRQVEELLGAKTERAADKAVKSLAREAEAEEARAAAAARGWEKEYGDQLRGER